MERELYLIRHGETDFNKLGIVQGRGVDTDLNDIGKWQAQAFYNKYHHIPFDKIYTSTLKRTFQTVEYFLQKNIVIEQHEGLDEINWGIMEGKVATDEEKKKFNEIVNNWHKGLLDIAIDGGETPIELQKRQLTFLDYWKKKIEEKKVLVCMHGRAMRVFLCTLLGKELKSMDNFPHNNVCLYILKYIKNKFVIDVANDLSHLDEKV